MKLKPLIACMALAASLSSLSASYAADDARKDAASATKSANDALYNQLPFSDKTDFDNAHKGFIAALLSTTGKK